MPINIGETRRQGDFLLVDMNIELPNIFKSPGVSMSANVDIPVAVKAAPGHEDDAVWVAGRAREALIVFALALARELGLDVPDIVH